MQVISKIYPDLLSDVLFVKSQAMQINHTEVASFTNSFIDTAKSSVNASKYIPIGMLELIQRLFLD